MLDIFAFIVMFVIVAAMIVLIVKLGEYPGKIARLRNHPQADAIHVCGWLGLATLGLLWPIALIWSHMKPFSVPGSAEGSCSNKDVSHQVAELQTKVSLLENELDQLRLKKGEV